MQLGATVTSAGPLFPMRISSSSNSHFPAIYFRIFKVCNFRLRNRCERNGENRELFLCRQPAKEGQIVKGEIFSELGCLRHITACPTADRLSNICDSMDNYSHKLSFGRFVGSALRRLPKKLVRCVIPPHSILLSSKLPT